VAVILYDYTADLNQSEEVVKGYQACINYEARGADYKLLPDSWLPDPP